MNTENNILEPDLEALTLHGVHLGSLKSHSHPKMKPYVWSNRNIFQIIDLEKSREDLKAALDFLVESRKKGGIILFVGTGFAAKEITKKVAEDLDMPYVTERWLGGTLTNFPIISRRIGFLKNLESQKAAGEFAKYTKYEALKLEEKIKKLRKDFGGLINLNRLPDAIWISSANYDKIAVKEAIKKNVPVVGLVNTNADPTFFDCPIPANDNAVGAVSFILNLVREALINIEITAPVEAEPEEIKK